jgi:hypothetical protein
MASSAVRSYYLRGDASWQSEFFGERRTFGATATIDF